MANTQNLVQGTAVLYWAPLGSDEPEDITTAPSGDWTDLGITKGGVSISSKMKYIELQRDKSPDISDHKLLSRRMAIGTSLAEQTLENYKIVMNGGTITEGLSSREYEPVNTLTGCMLAVDGYAPEGCRRRIIFRNVLQISEASFKYAYNMESFFKTLFIVQELEGSAPYRIIDGVPS